MLLLLIRYDTIYNDDYLRHAKNFECFVCICVCVLFFFFGYKSSRNNNKDRNYDYILDL